MVMFLAFSPIFIILTISYEGLFYFAFCLCLFSWVRLENRIYRHSTPAPVQSSPTDPSNPLAPAIGAAATRLSSLKDGDYRSVTLSDARIALFFLFFLQSGFFSTGNIASISSFSLDAVYRLIPVFEPFSQTALLLFKIMIPFATISANLGILNRRLGVAPSALFMLVVALGDVMTLNFFYMVRDEGSWLDIGTTISHFVIASLMGVFVAALEFISEVIIRGVKFESGNKAVAERPSGVEMNGKVNGHGTAANGSAVGEAS
jgi:GPI ethanolamine phosphate transferase 1